MSKLPDLPTFEYTVGLLNPASVTVMEADAVLAAYFQESGAYTVFKDDLHTAVAAFRTELVTEIRRSDDPVDDA